MTCVYIITNRVNGKQYVGCTALKPPERRLAQHVSRALRGVTYSALSAAIVRHGAAAFSLKVMKTAKSVAAMKRAEIKFIAELNTRAPRGYNLTDGGDGLVNPSLETREKIAKSQRGVPKPISESHRRSLSVAMKGRAPSAATLQAARLAHARGPRSQETKDKIRATMRKNWGLGYPEERRLAIKRGKERAKCLRLKEAAAR